MTPAPRDPRGLQPATHWEGIYAERGRENVSWYEETPTTSAELVLGDDTPRHVVDVGAGASALAEALLDAGVAHVTLLDLSMGALALTAARLDERANQVTTVVADVLTHPFAETYDVWHDRAVYHFLVEAEQRSAYADQVRRAVAPGGRVVVGAFALDGPEECSGLPVRRYDAETLAAELGEGFTLLTWRRAEHHTPWDDVQPFTWVVLRRD